MKNVETETQVPIQFGTFDMSEILQEIPTVSTPAVLLTTEVAIPSKPVTQQDASHGITRRVAYTQRTTEERCFYPPSPCAMNDEDVISDSEFDESSESPLPLTSTSRMGGFPLSSSLHGLSLVSATPPAQKLMEERAEVLVRKPMDVQETPVNSTTPRVAFHSTLEVKKQGENVQNKLTKSAKRRLKKKQKQQQQQSTGSPCLKLPCMQPSTSGPSSKQIPFPVDRTPPVQQDSAFHEHLRNLLSEEIPKVSVRFQAQGIRNLGSTCFLASAIQFLLGCPEFCWLMIEMSAVRSSLDPASYPVIHALGSLAHSLQIKQSPQQHKFESRKGVVVPDMLAPVVKRFQLRCDRDSSIGGKDVQEFLLFILDQTERELIELKHTFHREIGGVSELLPDDGEEDDAWMIVGKKNKVSTRRNTGTMESSILSSVFGGMIQSEVRAPGMVPSITSNPFIILVLDILSPSIHSIEDALDLYTIRDSIPDYRLPGSHQKTSATKINLFKELPKFLVLCLKQYTYNGRGIEKMHKYVNFGSTLKFKRSWMADGHRPLNYQLLATCNHHGYGRGGKTCFVRKIKI